MKPETLPAIPDNLRVHLHRIFRGRLSSPYEHWDNSTVRKDKVFYIYPLVIIAPEVISEAVLKYYEQAGLTVQDDGNGVFCIKHYTTPIFIIVVTSQRGQITVSTELI